jgi:hypothetical protein
VLLSCFVTGRPSIRSGPLTDDDFRREMQPREAAKRLLRRRQPQDNEADEATEDDGDHQAADSAAFVGPAPADSARLADVIRDETL